MDKHEKCKRAFVDAELCDFIVFQLLFGYQIAIADGMLEGFLKYDINE